MGSRISVCVSELRFCWSASTRVTPQHCVQYEVFPKDFGRSFLNPSSMPRLQQVSIVSVKATIWKNARFALCRTTQDESFFFLTLNSLDDTVCCGETQRQTLIVLDEKVMEKSRFGEAEERKIHVLRLSPLSVLLGPIGEFERCLGYKTARLHQRYSARPVQDARPRGYPSFAVY